MLMYGNYKNIPDIEVVVYNLSSLREGYCRLNLLIPPRTLGLFVDRDFDIAYANYIMNNDIVFTEFFNIIHNLYIGKNVYIIIDEDFDWSENIAESLFKLIQQRYGYNATYISNFEDFIFASNNNDSEFNGYFGIANLDQDKTRFEYICEQQRLSFPGEQIYSDPDLDCILDKYGVIL